MTDTLFSSHAARVAPADDEPEQHALLDEALLLEHVSGRAWRVCDSRRPEGSDRRFLGFVEERDGLFEVMQIAETFIWTSFDSMRFALDHIVATNARVVDRRALAALDSTGQVPRA